MIFLFFLTDGNDGMKKGSCSNRGQSSRLDDKGKSLILMNYFPTVPLKIEACVDNSKNLLGMLQTCHGAAGNRWPNFVAVDFYKVCVFASQLQKCLTKFIIPY